MFFILLEFSQNNEQYNDKDWYNGSIKSITLENFMCHSNFHLALNPRINFISGLNGSGKSAIQAALVVGFGARASITQRASALKSLIKYGCSSATITITIANAGEKCFDYGPYKPEVYGKQITLKRVIMVSNCSYKFLNENGKIVKSDKNELRNLTLHFNICVNNPICVMNQSMVKTFHKSSNPKDKYDLFYKAISANEYYDNIEETKVVAEEHAEKLLNVESVLTQCFKEVDEFKIHFKKSEQLNELNSNKKIIENEYAWFKVSKLETNYKICLKQIETHKNNISQGIDKTKILEENIKTNSEILIEKKDKLSKIENSRSKNHFNFMEMKQKLQNKIEEYDLAKQYIRKYDSALKLLMSDREDLEKHIEIERQKGNTNTLTQDKDKLASYERNIIEVEAAMKTNINHEQIILTTIDNLKHKIGNLKNNEITPLQKRVSELNKSISSMSRQQDRIHFYGNWMPQLVLAIENAFNQNKFKKSPLGPIGTYIKVNEDKWIFSIENHLGRATLRTFLVDNIEDNKVLQSIMDKIIPRNTRKPTVITSKFFNRVHDITTKETKNSMFSMLTFINPVVANSLIDNNRIETIMLIDDTEEAMALMENVSRVPRNCHFSLTLEGTQVYPSPSYRVYSLQHSVEPVLLQSDVSVAKNNLKYEKQQLETKINVLNKEFDNLEQVKLEKQQILKKIQSETRFLKVKFDEYGKNIKLLKAKCEEEQDDRMSTLTEEINEVNLKIAKTKEMKENALEPITIKKKEIEEINEKLSGIKSIIDKTDRTAILELIDTLQSEIDKHKIEILQISSDLSEQKKALKDLVKLAETLKNNIEQKTASAQCLCEKIVVTRNEHEILNDMEDIHKKIIFLEMELEKKGIDHMLLSREYIKKKEEYVQHSALHKQILDIYECNMRTIELNTISLKNYIELIKVEVIEDFELVLKLRKIKGKLEIDSDIESMVITMFDNISTSCASGGERTFATVALIIALWNNMNLPFYSIDEYDVYMDNVNRLATTDLLMAAIENRRNQYIFLTPQDISHIKNASNVKIVQLKEPR